MPAVTTAWKVLLRAAGSWWALWCCGCHQTNKQSVSQEHYNCFEEPEQPDTELEVCSRVWKFLDYKMHPVADSERWCRDGAWSRVCSLCWSLIVQSQLYNKFKLRHCSQAFNCGQPLGQCYLCRKYVGGRQRSSVSDKKPPKKPKPILYFFKQTSHGTCWILWTILEERTGRDPRWARIVPHNNY